MELDHIAAALRDSELRLKIDASLVALGLYVAIAVLYAVTSQGLPTGPDDHPETGTAG